MLEYFIINERKYKISNWLNITSVQIEHRSLHRKLSNVKRCRFSIAFIIVQDMASVNGGSQCAEVFSLTDLPVHVNCLGSRFGSYGGLKHSVVRP